VKDFKTQAKEHN